MKMYFIRLGFYMNDAVLSDKRYRCCLQNGLVHNFIFSIRLTVIISRQFQDRLYPRGLRVFLKADPAEALCRPIENDDPQDVEVCREFHIPQASGAFQEATVVLLVNARNGG
jgi:hypothetical protein